jgi:DNA-binding MarR family transcriptional regulator
MAGTVASLDERELAAWRGYLRTHATLLARLDDELQRRHRLPLSSYEVLLFLDGAPDRRLRMSELAASVLLSPSGVTRLVDRLVEDGLVAKQRCAGDRRGSHAVLTDAGAARFAAARCTHLAGIRAGFLDRLSVEQQAALADVWAALGPVTCPLDAVAPAVD